MNENTVVCVLILCVLSHSHRDHKGCPVLMAMTVRMVPRVRLVPLATLVPLVCLARGYVPEHYINHISESDCAQYLCFWGSLSLRVLRDLVVSRATPVSQARRELLESLVSPG